MENECQHIISGELHYFEAFANTFSVAISNPLFNIKLYLVKFPIHLNGLSNHSMSALPKYAG